MSEFSRNKDRAISALAQWWNSCRYAVYFYIVDHDPGFERFKQASKTVLSVAISVLLIYWWYPGAGTMLAGFCAGALSICHEGEDKSQQMVSMLLAGVTLIAAVWIGFVLTHYTLFFYIVFVVTCFAAFYVREKFGARYLSFPVFALVLMLVAFISPYEHNTFIYPMVSFTGFLAAFIVNFYLLPVSMRLQFKHNFEVFLYKYNKIISFLSAGIANSKSGDYYIKEISKVDSLIQKIKNERVLSKGMPLNINRQKKMEEGIINQYELFKLLSMLNESLFYLSNENIDRKTIILIRVVFRKLSKTVSALIAFHSGETIAVPFDKMEESLSGFKSYVYKQFTETDSEKVVHLSNLAFGIQRTSKLLKKQFGLMKKEEEVS